MQGLRRSLKRLTALALLALLCWQTPAAAVTISFYSHKLRLVDGINTDFPHGFVLLSGTTESGMPVNANLGFSATDIFINVLWERVSGSLDGPLDPDYVADATQHFSFQLNDDKYRAVLAVVEAWRTAPQPSYDMDTHNCVIFVKELAQAAGLSVSDDTRFAHTPGDFLEDVAARNAAFLSQYGMRVVPAALKRDALSRRVQELERAADRNRR